MKTVNEGFIPSWIVSSSNFGVEPGSGSGLMFGRYYKPRPVQHKSKPNRKPTQPKPDATPPGGSSAPKCPTAVSAWTFFSQTSGATESDATLKVVCEGSCRYEKFLKLQEQDFTFFFVNYDLSKLFPARTRQRPRRTPPPTGTARPTASAPS